MKKWRKGSKRAKVREWMLYYDYQEICLLRDRGAIDRRMGTTQTNVEKVTGLQQIEDLMIRHFS